MTPQGRHQLSGSNRWKKPALETQKIIHRDHPQLYYPTHYTEDSETQFRPLTLIEGYNPYYLTPSTEKIRTGTMIYMIKQAYNCDTMNTH